MPDDNRNLELILLGVTISAIAAYFVMTINNQLQLLNQNLNLYNQSFIYQQQYQYPQLQSQTTQPILIEAQSTPILKPVPKRIYNVQYDNDGFITDLNTTQ